MNERASNEEIVSALREVFPKMTEHEGKILWGNVINKNVYMPNGRDAGGSFRRWGRIISVVTGIGDYLNYYCSYQFVKMIAETVGSMDVFLAEELEILDTLVRAGWKIEEMNLSEFRNKGEDENEG